MKTIPLVVLACILGLSGGWFAKSAMNSLMNHQMMTHDEEMNSGPTSSSEPLYWVAPMDANYRRDKPGKSPMGMDLVPVYATDSAGKDDPAGTVTITPTVENNLGIRTQKAKMSALTPTITTYGYVDVDESQRWEINVRAAGWVENLSVHAVGESVSAGETLFSFYSPELVKAQEELLIAKNTGRTKVLSAAKERLQALGVDAAQIALVIKQGKALQYISVKAPADGVVEALSVREGGYVTPSQTLVTAVSHDTVWVLADVFERQQNDIKIGATAIMRINTFPNRKWEGKVDYVYPRVDPKTRTLPIRVRFNNPDRELKPNMFATLTLSMPVRDDVLVIPRSAVIRTDGMTRVVLSEGDGKFRSTRVNVGREVENNIEVLDGLRVGDRVVTSAQFLLDSESSQSAELSRLSPIGKEVEGVWTTGNIIKLMPDQGKITINHEPVPEWSWPGMTMDFSLPADLNVSELNQEQRIEFKLQKGENGLYEMVDYRPSETKVPEQLWIRGDVTVLLADLGMLTLSHGAIPALNWEEGEINFTVNDDVDLKRVKEGNTVELLLKKQGSDWLVIDLKVVGE